MGLKRTRPSTGFRRRAAAALLLALGLAALPVPSRSAATGSSPAIVKPVVVAIVEGGGVNVLHSDFGLPTGTRLQLPKGLPSRTMVRLPKSGSFDQRVAIAGRGPLGQLEPGEFYGIQGTRILGVYVSPEANQLNIFENNDHATGTTSAAVGLEHGTNPNAWLVYVMGTDRAAWRWLADQDWIDVVSTSYYTLFRAAGGPPETCIARRWIQELTAQGVAVFSAAGNVESTGIAFAPSGVPEAYQVGGVDSEGRTYLPGRGGSDEAITPTRPYETGDRFDFPAADNSSLNDSMDFGGTSGATPSTAGRAAEIIQYARELLDSRGTGPQSGALASATDATRRLPKRGPLADGRFENEELFDLLRHVAIPAELAGVGRYLLEGYGALNEKAVAHAKRVLAGKTSLPERPEEDAVHEAVEMARAFFYPEARCS